MTLNKADKNFPDLSYKKLAKHAFSVDYGTARSELTKREKIRLFLQSNRFHCIVLIFILVDIVFVAAEIILEAEKKNESLDRFFRYASLGILSLFLLELIFKLVFLSNKVLHSKLEIFDAIVILVSFALDIAFLYHEVPAFLGFVAALRLWRLARIVNGIIVIVENKVESKIESYRQQAMELTNENAQLREQIEHKEALIKDIKEAYSI